MMDARVAGVPMPQSFIARRFHCREQGGFGMQRLGLGLSFCDGGGFQRERVAFLPAGDGGFLLVLLAIDGTPSGLPDDAAFHSELHSGTFRRDSGHVLDTFFGECFNHTTGNHVIENAVLF